ncbi:MAG: TonB-dependent receptor [Pseudomonadota bacterium]|nr:TonB-dependent receptor [Pseudomonadota bacterium]
MYRYKIICLILSGFFFGVSLGQQPEEIVISGFKPVTKKELGASISSIQSETLDAPTVKHFQDLVQFVPNMNFSGEGSRPRYFQIRGVGEREQYEGAPNPSVGFFVDDIDLSGIGGVTSGFDLDRVEILRGPQSTRFGSSALAGVVYSKSKEPNQDFEAFMELSEGSNDLFSAGVALGGSLSDTATGRLSVYQYKDNGFRKNNWLARDDTNQRDEFTIRSKINWEIRSNWEAILSLLYADFNNGYDAFSLDNTLVTLSDEPGEDSQTTEAASFLFSGPFSEKAEFTSITSIANSEILFNYDGDWVNEANFLPIISDYRYNNPRERNSISQEFRISSLKDGKIFNNSSNWVIGFSWKNLEEENLIDSTGVYVQADIFCPPLPDPFACTTDRQISSDFSSDVIALFASLDTKLSDQLDLSFGFRVEHWDAKYFDSWIDNDPFRGSVGNQNQFSPDDNLFGGHIAIQYDWSETLLTYARVARGFKAGGFNPSVAALAALPNAPNPDLVAYKNEYLWNYELGLKSESFGGSLLADVSIFYMDREDAQLSQSDQVNATDPNSFYYLTSNGEANVYGLESSLVWQVNDHWRFNGAFSLLDSEVDEWAVRPSLVGRDLAHAPSYTINLGADWKGALGWFVSANVFFTDNFYYDIGHDQKSKSYQLFNLSAGKDWKDWSVIFWGRNLFNKEYATRGFFFGNEPPDFTETLYTRLGDPRQIGVTLRYNY